MNVQIPTSDEQTVKPCRKCGAQKPLFAFDKHSREKDGFRKICKTCRILSSKDYYERNRDKKIQYQKCYSEKNSEAVSASKNKYYKNNKDKIVMEVKKWAEQNKEKRAKYSKKYYEKNKSYYHAHAAKRRALCRIQTIPLSKNQWLEIVAIYKQAKKISNETGVLYHVDHIMPLVGKTCCGLHVPWNLQIIPAIDNLRKSNKVP